MKNIKAISALSLAVASIWGAYPVAHNEAVSRDVVFRQADIHFYKAKRSDKLARRVAMDGDGNPCKNGIDDGHCFIRDPVAKRFISPNVTFFSKDTAHEKTAP